MQIKTKAVSETSFLHLRDAEDALMLDGKKPVGVTLYGPGSKVYQEAQSRNHNRTVDRLKKKGKVDQTADEKITEQAEFLAAITVGFDNLEVDTLTGHDLALAVYSDPSLGFLSQQVQAHVSDWSNFTKGSAKS